MNDDLVAPMASFGRIYYPRDRAAGSDGLVTGLHKDLVYRHVIRLYERVNDRSRHVLGVKNARSTGRSVELQRLPVVAQTRKVGVHVARLDGRHSEPGPRRLEPVPL